MCLLHVMHFMGFENITAIHLNHNWRGEESFREMERCKKFCEETGIKFYTETLCRDIPKTETAAREARYEFFRRCAEKFNSDIVFTAHNADDNAETLIYRIAKGTGLDGLAGISEAREIFYRPLLKVSRQEIEKYCRDNNLSPNQDSSNNDLKYKRNLIRHKVIPVLKDINPEFLNAVNTLTELAAETSEYFNKLTETTSTQYFLSQHKAVQTRIIKKMLVDNKIDYDKEKIELILEFIIKNSAEKSGRTYSLSSDLFMFANRKTFEIISKTPINKEEVTIKSIGDYNFSDYEFSLKECRECPEEFPPDNGNTAFVCLDGIDFTLRTRRDGDIIFPLGAGGRQKLKKYLNGKKVPPHKKDKLVFLCRGSEVLWAPGFGISERIKVKNKQVTHLLKLRRREE